MQAERSSRDVSSDAQQVDANVEAVNQSVSCAVSEESLDAWPSLIPASTGVLHAEDSNMRFMLWASFAEIYNEQVFDLLDSATLSTVRASRPPTLQLRDGHDGRPYIRGLREVQVCSADEAWRLVQIGRDNQHIASTRLNRASSRSHSIFTLRLIQVVDVEQPSVARVASLSFCDLAGSERSTASGGCNERIKEAGNINLSLMTLGRCIDALRKNQARADQSTTNTRASFRNSKLTRLFQSFLCGEGRVVMITNVSPCANVFDETLHALSYSAIASQVVLGPSGPPAQLSTSILTMPAPADKRKASLLGKHEAAAAAAKVVVEKKRKTCDDTIQEEEEEEDVSCCDDDDVSDAWKDERQKLLTAVQMLRDALVEEQKKNHGIRAEVCEEMQKQLVRIENDYQESTRRHEEIVEEKYERKMEIYMEAVQKSCKRQRPADDDDDYVPSVDLHAAEVKLSNYAHEVTELKNKIAEMSRELAAARENIGKLAAERDEVAERLTKAEFSASDAARQEKTQARVECTKLRNTVEELTNKLTEAEHRHEISCRQLRRDKAQLEQKLKELETRSTNEDALPTSDTADNELDKSGPAAKVIELEAALMKEQDSVRDLEQRLKLAEDDMKAVDNTWAERCKEVEAERREKCHELTKLQEKYEAALVKEQNSARDLEQRLKLAEDDMKAVDNTWAERCKEVEAERQEKCHELTKLQEKYDVLERNMKDTARSLEEAEQAEEKLQTAQNELRLKEKELNDLTTVLQTLRDEVNSLTVESENVQADLLAKESECVKLKTEIGDLKQQSSAAVSSSNDALQEKVSDILRLEKELSNWRADRNRLVAELEKSVADKDAKESECEKLKTEIGDLKQQSSAAVSSSNDALQEKVSDILRLEKELEAERASRCQLEGTAADYEKKLDQLKEKDRSQAVELADRAKQLQALHATLRHLKQKSEEDRLKLELALKDARSKEEVVEQMKLTITEQEMTMQTQDQTLKSEESNAKSLEKQLYQREMESSNLRKQLEAAQEKIDKRAQEMKMLNTQFHALKTDREKELSNWRADRDRLVAELEKSVADKDAEIQFLKAGSRRRDRQPSSEDADRKVEALQRKVEQLSRTASAREQMIGDLREQNHQLRQLQHQSNVDDDDDRDSHQRRRNAPRKSRIPTTTQRMPLRAADGNADVSVGVLADGGVAVDLDETVGPSKRSTRRCHISHENAQPKTLDEQGARASRSRRKRTTGLADTTEPAIAEEPQSPPQTRRLRSRHC